MFKISQEARQPFRSRTPGQDQGNFSVALFLFGCYMFGSTFVIFLHKAKSVGLVSGTRSKHTLQLGTLCILCTHQPDDKIFFHLLCWWFSGKGSKRLRIFPFDSQSSSQTYGDANVAQPTISTPSTADPLLLFLKLKYWRLAVSSWRLSSLKHNRYYLMSL